MQDDGTGTCAFAQVSALSSLVGRLVNNIPSVLNIREGVILVWGMTACKLTIFYKHTATICNICYTFWKVCTYSMQCITET